MLNALVRHVYVREVETRSTNPHCCHISEVLLDHVASLAAQMVKNLPVMQEARVRSLGQEDLLKKGMATHSRMLDWRIP